MERHRVSPDDPVGLPGHAFRTRWPTPAGIGECEITGLPYQTGLLDIAVRGPGGPVRAIELDGRVAPRLIRPEAGTRRYLEIITG